MYALLLAKRRALSRLLIFSPRYSTMRVPCGMALAAKSPCRSMGDAPTCTSVIRASIPGVCFPSYLMRRDLEISHSRWTSRASRGYFISRGAMHPKTHSGGWRKAGIFVAVGGGRRGHVWLPMRVFGCFVRDHHRSDYVTGQEAGSTT